jgi:N-glycosylase/DNA lyase
MQQNKIINRIEPAVVKITKHLDTTENTNKYMLAENQLWYELVACILGSRTKYELAKAFTQHLKVSGLLNIDNMKKDYVSFEINVRKYLSENVTFYFGGVKITQKYRYPISRANYIRRTAENIYRDSSMTNLLFLNQDPISARNQLILNVVGVGPKQASLFLRNIGYADNLAVLDTHVLKYMSLIKLIPYQISSIVSIIKYEKLEKILQYYAKCLNTKLANLDVAIWIVMRTYEREFQI